MSDEKSLAAVEKPDKWLGEQAFNLTPKTLDEAMKFAELISKSSLVPTQFRDKPGDILIAVQMGGEIGLKPMQAVQNIALINGRPCIYGDAMLAVIQASGLLEWVKESDDGNTATCEMKRRGYPETTVRTFSMEDAKQAGLAGKQGPWTNYPKRMRQMRARGFCARDLYADVLKGLLVAEEAQDYEVVAKVDEQTTVVMPRRQGQEAKQQPQTQEQAATGEAQSQQPQSFAIDDRFSESAGAIITKVTKFGPNFYVYVGDAKFVTDSKDLADVAKEYMGNKTPVEITHEPEKDGVRRIVEFGPSLIKQPA